MKRIAAILMSVLLSTIVGACNVSDSGTNNNSQTPTPTQLETPSTETSLTEAEKELLDRYTFLVSFEGNQYQGAAYEFYRAYFLADIETAKSLMANPDDTDLLSGFPEERKSLDDISWLVLKVNNFIPSGENTGQVNAQYEIREAQKDSFDYLGIDMDCISGEWKVTNFYVEK